MIVPDLNLLLYAHVDAFGQHGKARSWWEALMAGDREVGLALPVVFGFIRLATNRRVFSPPMSVDDALQRVQEWLEQPHVRLLVPGPRHLEITFHLLRVAGAAANLTTDAQIAALAIEHQADLHSNDSDFARFPGLRWVNPLDSPVPAPRRPR